MKRTHKIFLGIILTACGIALIAWNLRDPDAAYREQPSVKTVVTLEQVPPPVRATIARLSDVGGKVDEIQQKRRGDEVKYQVEVISGSTKTESEISPEGAIIKQKTKKLKS